MTDVKKLIDVEQLKKDVSFSDTDLTSPMMEQASLYAHYAQICAEAGYQVDKYKQLVEVQEARLDKEIRDAAAESGEKLTEKKITAAILTDMRYVGIVKKLNEAKMISTLAKEALESLKHRRDMLVQIGVTSREEMKGELYIKKRDAASVSSRERALEVAGGSKN